MVCLNKFYKFPFTQFFDKMNIFCFDLKKKRYYE